MTDSIKREIERLLDEPGDLPASGPASDRLRSRLTATLSEALEGTQAPSTASGIPDIASMAAFVDGQLSGAEQDRFMADLARQPGLRADLESSAALVGATSDSALEVPAQLLARASARFAPAPPSVSVSQSEAMSWDLSSFLLSIFQPKQRIAWALVAALAVIVAVPAGMIIRDQSGGGAQPELSGVSEPVKESSQAQKDKEKACEEKAKENAKEKAKAEKTGAAPARAPSDANEDPCDSLKPKQDGAVRK